jgi:phosphatidylserine/phosphatidylglycerophosphate/cardiolipin synthase-like enzyme
MATTPARSPVLELYALDLWGQALPAGAKLTVTRNGQPVATAGFPVARAFLVPGAYRVTLEAAQHYGMAVEFSFDGSAQALGSPLAARATSGHGLAQSREVRPVAAGQPPVMVYTLYLGLRHRWYAAHGYPARHGNEVRLLMDGEEAWAAVHAELIRAQSSIMMTTWWWESNFELIRDPVRHITLTPEERKRNTIISILRASPAHKRILVNQFLGQDGLLSWMTVDSELRSHGKTPGDRFEFMGQGNPARGKIKIELQPILFSDRVKAQIPGAANRRFDAETPIPSAYPARVADLTQWPINVNIPHASYHQKFSVVDGQIAFVGGMNLRRVDWDTSQHRVFDPRRMLFDASRKDREAVRDHKRKSDTGPRKDFMVRIAGPAAQDVADVFKRRWDYLLSQKVENAAQSTPFEVVRNIPPAKGGIQMQITVTLPKPFYEYSILETWLNSVRNAQRYIYIEDQYFRIPLLNETIAARMKQVPGLRLLVVTKPLSEWTDPGCVWTHRSHAFFKTTFPSRYAIYQLKSFDTAPDWGWDDTAARFIDKDAHGKMLIVDDIFMSVGSANKNNRGVLYEAEMNAAIADPSFVNAARRRNFANILPAGTPATDDVATWWAQFQAAARWNDSVFARWKKEWNDIRTKGGPIPKEYVPLGFLYTLELRDPKKCLMESVGPDMT